MREIFDVAYGKKDCQKLDWYLPDSGEFDVIVWFHGGGMETGSYKKHYGVAESAVKHGYGFVSAEYSMYPFARWPEFITDAAEAVSYVLKNMEQYGGRRVIVTGRSAGAYLTMMLLMNPAYLFNAKADREKICAFISDSAQQTVHFNVLRERGQDTRLERLDEAAPLYFAGVNPVDRPLLLIAYENDMECRLEQNQLTLRALKRFNPDMPIELKVLPGKHVAGSRWPDENGEFPYLTALIDFVQRET